MHGLECKDQNKLLELGVKYLLLGKEEKSLKTQPRDKFELDFTKCEGLIRSSFKFDYKYDPYELDYLHYYDFYNDLENLSTSEFGNCCILNRVTQILNKDVSNIKDSKEQRNIIDAQKELQQRYCKNTTKEMTDKEKNSVMNLYRELGLMKGGT